MRFMAKRLGNVKVLFVAIVMIASFPGYVVFWILRLLFYVVPVWQMPEFFFSLLCQSFGIFLFPLRPIVHIITFYLMSGGSAPPQKTVREFISFHIFSCFLNYIM